ncbi:hypothetical protein [Alcanivorax sediminis]|uniref:Bacterial virulence factor lipase N-terminal domain-containing protein n=1 Tax=Alcanivorax sediminis TaxID=2663008 RepID=A0A6N7LVN4_9GAMM|nr:hypothetical protein [Alcanivorax sediminis]MQX54432.1 hypothetical protein [Alcanivorax sediminis]
MHIYKKVLPVAVAMALAACGGGSDRVEDQSEGATFLGTYPKFNPVTSDLPLNTDLIFAAAATSDGTANVGVPENAIEAAVNALDGFSTTAYFDIGFAGGSIDASTICVPGGCEGLPNVYLVPLDTSDGDGDALNPANIAGVNQAAFGTTAISASVVSLNGGTDNTLRITPLRPLLPKTKYLVFVTNSVLDADGDPIKPSTSYNLLGENEPAVSDSLAAVRGAIQGWETIAGGLLNALSGGLIPVEVAKDSVAISYTFTTTDPQTPLTAMAAPRGAIAFSQIEAGVPAQAALQNASDLEAGQFLSTPKARNVAVSHETGVDFNALTQGALGAGVGKLYTGAIDLPYYQSAPASALDFSFLQKSWTADQVLGSQLGEGIPPMDVDGSYNVTYRYPFAAQTGTETVPLQVTLPNPALAPSELGGATCANVRDNAGYPTVIYVHGITSDRTSVVALAHTLASRCIATVAIDLPMHGVPANSAFAAALNVENSALIPFSAIYNGLGLHERHFNVAQDASGNPVPMNFESPTALDGSGSWFINLADLKNTRDNLRQGVMDLLNLNASLGAISALNIDGNGALDTSKVSVVGVSLGAIVGTAFTSTNQVAISTDSNFGGSNLNPVRGFVASVGGTQLSHLLNNSQAFAPRIQAGLAANGVNVGTSNYESFLYVAQSTVSSGDPVNFAGSVGALAVAGLPVLIQQVNGDTVVPNGDPSLPMMGTAGLATLSGAVQLSPGAVDLTSQGNAGIVKMTAGGHGSLLTPSGGAQQVTAEMQAQVMSFVLSGGTQVLIGSQAPADIEAVGP